MSQQLAFEPILSQAHKSRWAIASAYARRHRATYVHFAWQLRPMLDKWPDIWDRLAFAILSANTSVGLASAALRTLRLRRGCFPPTYRFAGITPDRIKYVNALPVGEAIFDLLKRRDESWHQYRLRLARDIEGLGLTKASFAAALLYPQQSRVCCLDVWMLRWFGLADGLLSPSEYRRYERQLRRFGARHHVSGAIAQWMIWDLIRTGTPVPLHPIFQR